MGWASRAERRDNNPTSDRPKWKAESGKERRIERQKRERNIMDDTPDTHRVAVRTRMYRDENGNLAQKIIRQLFRNH